MSSQNLLNARSEDDSGKATSEAAALAKRYRSAAPNAAGSWDEPIASMLAHKSVRAYLPKPLPEGALETAVAAAQSAPTSSNMQSWSVVAIEDPARKSRLAKIAGGQKHIEQCPLLLVWLADLSRARAIGANVNAPTSAIDYLETFLVAVIDAALAAQNALAAFESLGLGTVYIGALRNDPVAVAAELDLPPEVFATFGLCVGYADPAGASDVKPRLPQAAVLHRERYRSAVTPSLLEAYDGDLRAFQAEQGMASAAWTSTLLARFRGPESLNGRDALRGALAKLGFPLR